MKKTEKKLSCRIMNSASGKLSTSFLQVTLIVFLLFQGVIYTASAQVNDPDTINFSGSLSVTNKGISVIPVFTLGKPALINSFSLSKGRFSFDPTLRFNLEGFKPWAFIFWFRYKVVDSARFSFKIGVNPSFSFKDVDLSASNYSDKSIMLRRYLAGELSPNFMISKKISINPFYLVGHGIGGNVNNYNNYVALRTSISNVGLGGDYSFSLSPQVYYLNLDHKEGFYVASGISFKKANFPFSISAMFNRTIDAEIDSDDFIWNVTLSYSFSQKYIRQ